MGRKESNQTKTKYCTIFASQVVPYVRRMERSGLSTLGLRRSSGTQVSGNCSGLVDFSFETRR